MSASKSTTIEIDVSRLRTTTAYDLEVMRRQNGPQTQTARAEAKLADIGAPPVGTRVLHEDEGAGIVLKHWSDDQVRCKWHTGRVTPVLVVDLQWQGKPSGRKRKTLQAHGLGEIELTPVRWLVQDIWTADGFGAVAGPEKSLKSYLVTLMAMSVATGKPFLGKFPVAVQGGVLFFAGEGSKALFKRRVSHLAKLFGFSEDDLRVLDGSIAVIEDVAQVQTKHFQRTLAEWLEARPALVVVDPFYAFHGASANAGNVYETAPILQALSEPCSRAGVALQVVFHFRKDVKEHDLTNITQAGPREWAHNWITVYKRKDPEPEEMAEQSFELDMAVGSREGYAGRYDIDVVLGPIDENGLHEGEPSLTVCEHSELPPESMREKITTMLMGNPWKLTKVEIKGRVKGAQAAIQHELDQMYVEGLVEMRDEKRTNVEGRTRTVKVYGLRRTEVHEGVRLTTDMPV